MIVIFLAILIVKNSERNTVHTWSDREGGIFLDWNQRKLVFCEILQTYLAKHDNKVKQKQEPQVMWASSVIAGNNIPQV